MSAHCRTRATLQAEAPWSARGLENSVVAALERRAADRSHLTGAKRPQGNVGARDLNVEALAFPCRTRRDP